MNPSFDLNLLPLARQGGQDQAELPDLYAVTPPRRPARGRESDSLIIYLSMAGNAPLSPEAHTQLLERLANKFYKTAGSVTSALRTVAEALNLYLLDRNLRSTSAGRQGIGLLVLAALRVDTLYMAHCGPVHAFIVTPQETQHLHDPQSAGRGLGLSRTTPVRFVQAKMNADDFLVLATQASPGWTASSLRHPQRQGIEGMRRQLLDNANQEINAVIVQAQTGTGKLRLLRRKAGVPDMAHPAEPARPASTPAAPPLAPVAEPQAAISSAETQDTSSAPILLGAGEALIPTAGQTPAAPVAPPAAPTTSQPQTPSGGMVSSTGLRRGGPGKPAGSTRSPAAPTTQAEKAGSASQPRASGKALASLRTTLAGMLATIGRALGNTLATIGGALLRLFKNLLPDTGVLRVPPSVMVFFALAVPLVLATIGGVVYVQRGRAQQHQVYYQQAVQDAANAATLTDPLEQRRAWQKVLDDLDKAEYYTLTTQSQELRLQVNAKLDDLNAVRRLDYQPAIVGGLDTGVRVTRLVATATDIYLLNAEQGSVLRAIMTGQGYEIDPNFQCGPTYGPISVGPLVDIAELPQGSFEGASLLGMDASGNLLYCIPGSQPYSATMAPPNTGFGEPSGMTLDRGDLYVLDPKVNAVWVYRNMEVRQQPRLFFGDYIPPMPDVIDMTVYNDELYLLHADGHITECTFSGLAESPTSCNEPYSYSDNRPGRQHGPVIEDAVFNQIYFSSFPDRSIYMLDPHNQAIYYFSVLLTLQWQYQPQAPLAQGEATAFAISSNRTAFLAISNHLYYAALP
jgi:Flp pilus assembly protein TadG